MKVLTAGALLLSSLVLAAEDRSGLDQVMLRVAAYTAQYESQLSSVLAEEHYEQQSTEWWMPSPLPQRRVLDSDFLFLRLPGGQTWLGLRDTFRIDGTAVRTSEAGVLHSLREGGADTLAETERIITENSRRNLGPVYRTINVPTIALDFFTARLQPRFHFSKSGEEGSRNHRLWIVRFDETVRPTVIRTREGADQRARGTAWIDPATGAVEHTVMDLGDGGRAEGFVQSRFTVIYAAEPSLGFLVPVDMVESYQRAASPVSTRLQIVAHATYSHFRRFQVSARIVQP